GGQGVPVGRSGLLTAVDYADTFTLGVGSRAGVTPGQHPLPAAASAVETNGDLAPPATWLNNGLWAISTDAAAGAAGSGAGSAAGFVQGPAQDYVSIKYGLRPTYAVQFDMFQTAGRVSITSGANPGGFAPGQELSVFLYADDSGTPGVALYNQSLGTTFVYDTPDGNPQAGAQVLRAGVRKGQWYNFAVTFDQAADTLALYNNERLLKVLDLRTFLGGAFREYS